MYSKINGDKTLTRTNSICPPPEERLRELVLSNDVENLENFSVNEKLLRHVYEDHNIPILLIACIEEYVRPETIQVLLESVDTLEVLRYSNEDHWEVLHFAAKRANYSILKLIIDKLKTKNVNINNVLAGNSNALHILVRYADRNSKDFISCAELLIKEGINVNWGDNKSMSPILWAAKKGLRDIIRVILERSPGPVDIDSHTSRDQSARDIITNEELYSGDLPKKIENNNHNDICTTESKQKPIETLFGYIMARPSQEKKFITYNNGNIKDLANCDNGNDTLLQKACENGTVEIVKHLRRMGAEQGLDSCRNVKNKKTPLEIAADHGYHEIVDVLLHNIEGKIPVQVLNSLLKYYGDQPFERCDKQLCCKNLIQKLKNDKNLLDINEGDKFNNTPLHYALRYADHDTINDLFVIGASLGAKNKFDIMPIQDMEPELLEKHLNNCIQFDLNGKKDKEDFSVTFKYDTLLPPSKRIKSDLELGNGSSAKELVQETEVIAYMSKAPEFKYLMTHPVIVTFLFMKWHLIRALFFTNLMFYIAFFASLVSYVFSYYINFTEELTSFENSVKWISYAILVITFFVLLFREFFQMIILPKKYFTNFENLIEIILIVIAGSILFISSPSENTRKQLSSLAILLAAFELVLMVGQHPKLSTNVVMLRTVSYNFFKFLLWYSLLLIAFALSFYILFTAGPKNSPVNQTDGEGDEDTFANPGKSVFKTIIMLTGEFDASDLNFETFPIVSKLIFVFFIFMIAIILLNLLNGLAVNDTQMIKNDAERLGHISRAQHIRYVESMLLGNIAPNNVFKKINDICCCMPFVNNWNLTIFKPLAESVCLFPHFFDYEIEVFPNRGGIIATSSNWRDKCCFEYCQRVNLDKETVLKINEIVQAKKEQMKSNPDSEKLEIEIIAIKKQLENLLLNFNQIINQNAIKQSTIM